MLFEELQVEITDSSDVELLDSDRTRTPAWLIRLACADHAGVTSLAECRDLCEWFGVDEKQIQPENEQKAWLYAAIDVETKVVLHARLRGTGAEILLNSS